MAARIVDLYPSDNDEISVGKHILSVSSSDITSTLENRSRAPAKSLVPKSATKPIHRKIRRFETPKSSAGSNVLFQRCAGQDDSPRRSPSKKSFLYGETPSKAAANRSIFDDESPPAANRTIKSRRHKFAPIAETEERDENDHTNDPIDDLLHGAKVQGREVSSLLKISSLKPVPAEDIAKRDITDDPNEQMDVLAFNDDASPAGDVAVVDAAKESNCPNPTEYNSTDGETSLEFTLNESNTTLGSSNYSSSSIILIQEDAKIDLGGVLQPESQDHLNQNLRQVARSANVATGDLADALAMLDLDRDSREEKENAPVATPPATPKKQANPSKILSPSKRAALIPKTPHRPSMDTFWDQEVVNDWNEKHSPRKLVLPPALKSPSKQCSSPRKQERREFDLKRHALADEFLRELDRTITQGQIAQLATSTGGVKVVWSKTLNTTAGRANWRREKVRMHADGTSEGACKYFHHASIELAEKVINDEDKLLNTLAHEFCHLANFMITGITNNPHGKEFKAWAAKCTQAFGVRGVNVTTKHSYEIDFKYVWECTACGIEVRRHSKSVDPKKHRCGSCKSALKQTKPTPRGNGKPSEYQLFVKEQMKVVKDENPGIAQKDVMKVIAAKWAKRGEAKTVDQVAADVEDIEVRLVDLTV